VDATAVGIPMPDRELLQVRATGAQLVEVFNAMLCFVVWAQAVEIQAIDAEIVKTWTETLYRTPGSRNACPRKETPQFREL